MRRDVRQLKSESISRTTFLLSFRFFFYKRYRELPRKRDVRTRDLSNARMQIFNGQFLLGSEKGVHVRFIIRRDTSVHGRTPSRAHRPATNTSPYDSVWYVIVAFPKTNLAKRWTTQAWKNRKECDRENWSAGRSKCCFAYSASGQACRTAYSAKCCGWP